MRLKRHCVRILIEEKWQVLTDKYIALIKFPLFATDDVKYKIYLSTVKKNDWDTLTIFNEQSFCFINGTLLVNIHVYIEKKNTYLYDKSETNTRHFPLIYIVWSLSYRTLFKPILPERFWQKSHHSNIEMQTCLLTIKHNNFLQGYTIDKAIGRLVNKIWPKPNVKGRVFIIFWSDWHRIKLLCVH